jgi:hypothetical protein
MTKNTCVGPVASGTLQAQSIYVDKAATGSGTGVDWTNAFTTIQTAVNSLPAIINHEITIYVRKGVTPYRETVTIKRIIAAGSLILRGEYYHNYEVASNSTANKLVKNASDSFSDVEVGDYVYILKYSTTYGTTYPDNAYYGTVSDVTNKESGYVTISMNASVTPTTGYRYVIIKTAIDGSDNGTTPVRTNGILVKCPCTIAGFWIGLNSSYQIDFIDTVGTATAECLYLSCPGSTFGAKLAFNDGATISLNNSIIVGDTTRSRFLIYHSTGQSNLNHCAMFCMSYSSGLAPLYAGGGIFKLYGYYQRHLSTDDGKGLQLHSKCYSELQRVGLYGYGASNKLATGILAEFGSTVIQNASNIDSATITTIKTPANWAATTDGSYIL